VSFGEFGFDEILPRFYQRLAPKGYNSWSLDRDVEFVFAGYFQVKCTNRHLLVKYGTQPLCHLNLYASPRSVHYFQGRDYSKMFAVSHDHKHAALFGTLSDLYGYESSGLVECPKYNNFEKRRRVSQQPCKFVYRNHWW
jgi:hypothetical protein